MLSQIKNRLPGGIMAKDLCYAIKDLMNRSFDLWDKEVVRQYFQGSRNSNIKVYNDIEELYLRGGLLNFNGIKIPRITEPNDKLIFAGEFFDFIYPYLINKTHSTSEGPYLYSVANINKGDIVIDAGANIGLFSALVSHLGAIVYAFEPVKKIRENYLEKTAKLNPNIHIVPEALSNTCGIATIDVDTNNIGGSSIVMARANCVKGQVQTITLDEWQKDNKIPRIDFIKADIEGAERLMLSGAQNVLKEFSPKLAICTYHLPDDKQVLTGLILKANPNYKIEYRWEKLYAHV